MAANDFKMADFGRRCQAYALDAGLALVLALAASSVFSVGGAKIDAPPAGEMAIPRAVDPTPFLDWLLSVFLLYCLASALIGVFEAVWARSPGKAVLGMKIQSLAGGPAPALSLALRAALKQSAFAAFLLGWALGSSLLNLLGVGLLFAFFAGCWRAQSFTRTALHDTMAGTGVYRIP